MLQCCAASQLIAGILSHAGGECCTLNSKTSVQVEPEQEMLIQCVRRGPGEASCPTKRICIGVTEPGDARSNTETVGQYAGVRDRSPEIAVRCELIIFRIYV